MTIYCSIPVWLRLAIVWAWLLALPSVADAQHLGVDSAQKVNAALVTAIPSSQTITSGTPFQVAITAGAGATFAKIPKPFAITCKPQAETHLTYEENFRVSAVSNDTLTLTARARAIGRHLTARTWARGRS